MNETNIKVAFKVSAVNFCNYFMSHYDEEYSSISMSLRQVAEKATERSQENWSNVRSLMSSMLANFLAADVKEFQKIVESSEVATDDLIPALDIDDVVKTLTGRYREAALHFLSFVDAFFYSKDFEEKLEKSRKEATEDSNGDVVRENRVIYYKVMNSVIRIGLGDYYTTLMDYGALEKQKVDVAETEKSIVDVTKPDIGKQGFSYEPNPAITDWALHNK